MASQPEQLVLADRYEYPGVAFIQSHPDRLATIARLAGMNPASVDRCRVLEVACGEGANLLGMAYTLPNSSFLGFDIGTRPIDKANATIEALNLRNAVCVQADLLQFDPHDKVFDYVIAHGFYSWVPQDVRGELMSLIARVLAPQGVAYISYNAYPGSYSAQRFRDFAMLHLDTIRATRPDSLQTPVDEIRETRRLMQMLRDNATAGPPSQEDLFWNAKLTLDRPPAIGAALIVHDLLVDDWRPFTLQEFTAHAAAHGLQFLNEAIPAEPDFPATPEPLMSLIREASHGDRIAEAQYVDYLVGRKFRQSLLCRADVRLAAEDQVGALSGMYAGTELRETETASDGSVTFAIAELITMTTSSPAVIGLLRSLIEAYPQRIAIQDFTSGDEESNRNLYRLLIRMYRDGSLELYTQQSPAGGVTQMPRASALARRQAQSQSTLASLHHDRIEMPDENARWFLRLLDGTRDLEALFAEGVHRFPGQSRAEIGGRLSAYLDDFARKALLHQPRE